jgi:preprotein translocase subunit SecB
MDAGKQPGIRFDNVILRELTFARKLEVPTQSELSINFKTSSSISPDKTQLVHDISCEISEKGESFSIKCSMIGLFSIVPNESNMDLELFAKENASALMFPFLREVIASTTLRAGVPPIMLPPLNIHAIAKQESI